MVEFIVGVSGDMRVPVAPSITTALPLGSMRLDANQPRRDAIMQRLS